MDLLLDKAPVGLALAAVGIPAASRPLQLIQHPEDERVAVTLPDPLSNYCVGQLPEQGLENTQLHKGSEILQEPAAVGCHELGFLNDMCKSKMRCCPRGYLALREDVSFVGIDPRKQPEIVSDNGMAS